MILSYCCFMWMTCWR